MARLDVTAIAAADPEEFAALCAKPPAVHRFPGSMAGRIQALCRGLVENWDGDVANAVRGLDHRRRAEEADRGTARVRAAEGRDLRRDARQAARHHPGGLAIRGRPVRRGRRRTSASPTSSTPSRCSRSEPRSGPPNKRPRAASDRPAPAVVTWSSVEQGSDPADGREIGRARPSGVITDAQRSADEELASRQRRYTITMLIRIPLLIVGAILAAQHLVVLGSSSYCSPCRCPGSPC